MGATLLVLANKQDIPSALTLQQIEEVRPSTCMGLGRPVRSVAEHLYGARQSARTNPHQQKTFVLPFAHVQTHMHATTTGRMHTCPHAPLYPWNPQALGLGDIAKRHWRIVTCSAHTGEGLLEGFEWIVKDISSRIYCFDE